MIDIMSKMVNHCSTLEQFLNSPKNINYIIGKDSKIYEMRRNQIGEFCCLSKKVVSGADITPYFKMKLPKIPFNKFLEIFNFFNDICDESSDEAFIQVYYDSEKQEYFNYCPEQKVSGASVRYTNNIEFSKQPQRYILTMDIHSHNIMSAFFSGTDDGDEIDTRIFAVVGNLNKLPEFKVRIGINGSFQAISMLDVFEFPQDFLEKATFTEHMRIEKSFIPKIEYPVKWKSEIKKIATIPTTKEYLLNYDSDWNLENWRRSISQEYKQRTWDFKEQEDDDYLLDSIRKRNALNYQQKDISEKQKKATKLGQVKTKDFESESKKGLLNILSEVRINFLGKDSQKENLKDSKKETLKDDVIHYAEENLYDKNSKKRNDIVSEIINLPDHDVTLILQKLTQSGFRENIAVIARDLK